MKISDIKNKRYALKRLVFALVGLLAMPVGGLPAARAASCMNLSDVPLESMEEEGPGLIMFVIDDSGSMDWSIMADPSIETNGVFQGYEYIFPDPGDNVYNPYYGSSYDDPLEGGSAAMKWMSQWSGYNGMYYNPEVEYTPWPWPDSSPPFESPADVDHPRSNPMDSGNTLSMGTVWQTLIEGEVVVDNSDAQGYSDSATGSAYWIDWNTSAAYNRTSRENYGGSGTVSARWEASAATGQPLAAGFYDIQVYYPQYYRYLSPQYEIYDGATLKERSAAVDQSSNGSSWVTIASNVLINSGTGIVRIDGMAVPDRYRVNADAVKFTPATASTITITRRHYYVRSGGNTYLVNLLDDGSTIEYYRVGLADPDDSTEVVTGSMLTLLVAGPDDVEITALDTLRDDRSWQEEAQNFANWYSFYRRRELTAKNAIANVISTIEGVFIGILSINSNIDEQILKPVRVNLGGILHDESEELLTALYDLDSYGGTPLRNGLKMAGEYFKGNLLKPASSEFIDQDTNSYPYFTEDEGGSCQQAFTILFTDGYYSGSSPGVGNEDGNDDTDYDGTSADNGDLGDNDSDTLADVAMRYYEDDLKNDAYLANNLSASLEDPAPHQHMVTYTVAFGVSGQLDNERYADCPLGACPNAWPSNGSDVGKIDDLFHAAINGRGAYIAASNSEELNAALSSLQSSIENRLGASAALATNAIQLSVGSVIYQGTYNTSSWFGEVSALPLDVLTGVVSETPIWQASNVLPDWDQRNILSYSNGTGIVFDDDNLTTAQKDLLVADAPTGATAADIVDYIRGDIENSVQEGGLLRNRSHPLGDIVHSAPAYFKGTVYIGANDGMLHAFDSRTGVEKFAYIPGLVYENLGELTNPNYSHKYYVDNTAAVATVGSQDILVCGLGKGGKGYFALDVTDPGDMESSDVLWEFTDTEMGYSFSKAFIVKTKAAGDVVIFGNGYGTSNGIDGAEGSGHAILYVLDALNGTEIQQFDTNVGSVTECNGMSTPALVDVELDGYVDYVYAGDLKGNMWKIDLRGGSTSDWTFAYKNGRTPMPLIRVRNENGDIQPITAAPEVMLDCSQVNTVDARGLMVVFGTGRYLDAIDLSDTTMQAFYGIWDWAPIWEETDGLTVAREKYLGTFSADRSLSNLSGATLLEQAFVFKDSDWGVLTDNPPDWYNPFDFLAGGIHMGWHIDLVESGERSVLQPTLNAGAAILISTIPSRSPCEAGGSSGTYIISACSGGRYPYPAYDVNGDGVIDKNDTVEVNGTPIYPQWYPDPNIIYDVLIISGEAYRQDAQGNIEQMDTFENLPGMFFWRVIGQ